MRRVVSLMVFMLLFFLLVSYLSILIESLDINNYPLENAILIDNFISYDKFGFPHFFVIYQFEDNSIKKFNVNEDFYYKNVSFKNENTSKILEGS